MEDRSLKIQIGLFVVAAVAVLVFLVFLNSEGFRRQYTVYIKPQTAPGVTKDTPIRKNGILIGRVGSVKSEDDHVVLMLRINADEAVYTNDVCSIGTDSFLGDSVVEIIPLKAEERGVPLSNGGALTTVNIRRNPLEIVDVVMKLESKASDTMTAMQKASDQVAEAGAGIRSLTEQVQDAIGSNDSDFKKLIENVQQTSKKAQLALDNFNKLFEGINEVVGTRYLTSCGPRLPIPAKPSTPSGRSLPARKRIWKTWNRSAMRSGSMGLISSSRSSRACRTLTS